MPKAIDGGRIDLILQMLEVLRVSDKIGISFENTEYISPAGYAILAILCDAICEHGTEIVLVRSPSLAALPSYLLKIGKKGKSSFLAIEEFEFELDQVLVFGKVSSLAFDFVQKVSCKFENLLGEDKAWDVDLILKELMQNAVDHSTSERYFLYAGVNRDRFEFGVLDSGVSIPAKMETVYDCKDDIGFLKLALKKDVGTRRERVGGLGLFHMFNNIKREKGKLVIVSRFAQVRRYFSARSAEESKLKHKLRGTWCMGQIPLEK